MSSRSAAILLFAALLAPSAWFAWSNRDMPQLGRAHDDAIYYTVSKSVAEGTGYRILNLPEAPYQTKYPPILIWLLALAWKIDPRFPQNLAVATAIQWAILPVFLGLAGVWLRRAGFSSAWCWAGVAILATGPYTVAFGAGIFTEALFAVFLLASLLLCQQAMNDPRKGWRWAAAAGVCAGIAYLTRTAGIVALAAMPGAFLLMRARRQAAGFFAAMLPFVAGWTLWAKLHQAPGADVVTLYNTDYFGFFLEGLRPVDLGIVVWKNFGRLLFAMGGLAFPLEADSMLLLMLRITVAAGMFHGLYRRRANRYVQFHAAFAGLTLVELLIWNFPPNLRLAYPLVPLFLAGLLWEAQHFAAMLRSAVAHPVLSQRIAGYLIGAAAAALLVFGLWMQYYMTFRALPGQMQTSRQVRAESEAAFAWIARNADPSANVLCLNPAVYLYSGRRTESIVGLPIHRYRSERQQVLAPMRDLPRHASPHPMEYFYVHDFDYDAFAPGEGDAAKKIVETNPALEPVFRSGRGVVYRLLSQEAPESAKFR